MWPAHQKDIQFPEIFKDCKIESPLLQTSEGLWEHESYPVAFRTVYKEKNPKEILLTKDTLNVN